MAKGRFCVKCGSVNHDNARFCSSCGYELDSVRFDLDSFAGFKRLFYSMLYHDHKFVEASRLLDYYEEHCAKPEDKQKLEEEISYNGFELSVYGAVREGNELDLLKVACNAEAELEAGVKLAAQVVNAMYWHKLFELRRFELVASYQLMQEADEVLLKLAELSDSCVDIGLKTALQGALAAYEAKLEPYNLTPEMRYAKYVQALDLEGIAEDAERYAERMASWAVVLVEDILETAITLHQASYLEDYYLDAATKEELIQAIKQQLVESSVNLVSYAQEANANIIMPLQNLIIEIMNYRRANEQADEKDETLKAMYEELDRYDDLLFGDLIKQEDGSLSGGCLSIMGELSGNDEVPDLGTPFVTDFLKAMFEELKQKGVEPQSLDKYF